ncbi:MAG: NAD(P)/FAD-dependent oxidoreductase [Mycobacteriales bacterium]
MSRPLPTHVDALVVGSGFSGLASAIRLQEAGRQVVVVEKGHDVGGTWCVNTYPACACDVPSHLYSFSFAPNPEWTRTFSPQPEIYAYLRGVAERYGVHDRTWFGTELLDAAWDEGATRWAVRTSAGELTCDVLVLGTGGLSEPSTPAVKGLESFQGTTFHSATWDHDHDLTGKRVAVIGTGASSIQFAPEVAKVASHTTVFQRTAPWILPRRDRAITGLERRLFRRFPGLQKVARGGIYGVREASVLGFSFQPAIMKLGEKQARRFIAATVKDPVTREKVTPSYRMGCKRVLLSNTWYPMLNRSDVSLVTDGIEEVTATGVVTRDAAGQRVEHPVDTIILGTGFSVSDPPVAHRVRGRDGSTLYEAWTGGVGMAAYRGLTVPGFPNLFYLVGPNTGLGHTSIVFIIERQVEHMVKALRAMDAAGVAAIEPRADVTAAYDAWVQRRLQGTVWNAGGCASWYLDANGRNSTLWPTFTFTYAKELRAFDLGDYELTEQPVTAAA